MAKQKLINSPAVRPVELEYALSEIVVKMTLKELCGSKWDNYPFDGEVEQNSFFFKRNNTGSRGSLTDTFITGTFYEHNGKTKVTIFTKNHIADWIFIGIFALFALILTANGLVDIISESSIEPFVSNLDKICISLGLAAIFYFSILIKSHRYIKIIKNTLDNVPLR